MSTPILATKLYIPPPRPKVVLRSHLIERLNAGLAAEHKLSLISAPAGFGKTTLVSEWIADCARPVAWLSLDEGDNNLPRFLAYLVSALQTLALPRKNSASSGAEKMAANIGAGVLALLNSQEPPSAESLLTTLLNEIAAIPFDFILVLDDYHSVDAKAVDDALTFLLEHQPPQMHLVIATREDPRLPLARLRVRGQLTELRAADLRFTPAEAAEFLNCVMGLNLSANDVAALDTRTEGWIAGLQLAALSMQGHQDTASFIKSFTGSHHFVLDYLIQEVLQRQPASTQDFLLRTSILDRLCASLCDAVLGEDEKKSSSALEYLEHSNLFIIPLDNERHWYRYHHLFGDLLRQRLHQSSFNVAELHTRASEWYENNNLMFEAFRHATAANDVERAVRLMESKTMPLRLPGVAIAVLTWLESLPTTILNAQPALRWKQAELLLLSGQIIGVEEKLEATEAALSGAELDDTTRNLIGKIALARAVLAQTQFQIDTLLIQARRALEYLHPDNLVYRSDVTQAMGFAYYIQGDADAANRAYVEALSIAQATGDDDNIISALTRLGQVQEMQNQLGLAAEHYQRALQRVGDDPPPNVAVTYLGLARVYYEWNELDTAERYGEQSLELARQYDQIVDRLILSELFFASLKIARGDASGAMHILAQTEQTARQRNFTRRLPDIAAAQVFTLLRLGNLGVAAELAQQYDLPMSQARVLLAQDNPSAALTALASYREKLKTTDWRNAQLWAMVLEAIAHHANNDIENARQVLGEVLVLAEPSGLIRTFVDEGERMRLMIADCRLQIAEHPAGIEKQVRMANNEPLRRLFDYSGKVLAAFPDTQNRPTQPPQPSALVEALSARELEVLRLIAQGLSNQEICDRLFLALSTVKGHSRIIFDKLQVRNRTEAVARGRELGLL
jgi:LuxR family transcriptional regulator, maltose regulon positive regulatory protein